MANSTVGNLPIQATPLSGADILPISRDGTNLNKTTLTSLKVFTDNNSFSTIAVAGQTNVVADTASDILTIVAGANMTITTDATGDSITFASTVGGGASVPTYGTTETVGRILATADLGNLIIYNSASDANFIIPLDTALSLTGNTSPSFRILQIGTGIPNIVGNGTSVINKSVDYPPGVQYAIRGATRYGVNTWVGE